MANSPDVSAYKDLTIFDENPVAILNTILEGGRALLPNWTPQAGQIEVVLAEIFADRTAQLVAGINRLPSATTEVLLQLFGLTRSDGTKATASINITQSTPSRLPAGTEFLYVDAVTGISYIYTLDEDFIASAANVAEAATVTALDIGQAYNISTGGSSLAPLTSSPTFISAVFGTDPSGGLNAETDAEYFDRGVALLASYTTATTTANQIKNYVGTNKTYAYRVAAYDRRKYRDRDTTSSSYGVHDGYVLVAVAGQTDVASAAATEIVVSPSNLFDLHTSLEARTPSGLSVEVMSAELAKVHVTASVKTLDGYTFASVKTAIETALQGYLSPNSWDWETQRVRRNEIIATIDAVAGVDYVDTLTMDAVSAVGSSNVGYYADSGGTKTEVSLTTSNVTDGTYAAGELGFYYVDADVAAPVIYEFVNKASVTVPDDPLVSGVATATFEAAAAGIAYNDTSNGGQVDSTVPLIGTGTVAAALGTATLASGGFTGGSDDINQFTVLNNASPTANVSTDIVLRNLGTLVTYGTLTITEA
ncbi:MAG: baseplate J/gp47 family protein [Opitutae bacterium]